MVMAVMMTIKIIIMLMNCDDGYDDDNYDNAVDSDDSDDRFWRW